jgi:hypothetical protein
MPNMSTAEMAIAELKNAPEAVAREALEFIVALKRRAKSQTAGLDPMGYPLGYFERTAGSFVNEPLERPEQAPLDPAPVW